MYCRAVTEPAPARLEVRGLRVELPDGRVLIDDLSLSLPPGEVAVLLGGSGAGKSTFARVLFERAELDAAGFHVESEVVQLDRGQLGLVPQRGALFDHLDVAGNIALALRYAETARGRSRDVAVAGRARRRGRAARRAGRLAVGRPGPAGRGRAGAGLGPPLLFLDEPSVGLDPHRVRQLARLIRQQVEALGAAAIVVTHDVALAAGVADALYLLSLEDRKLSRLFPDTWPGPVERDGVDDATRGRWLLALEDALVDHLATHGDRPPPRRAPRGRARLHRAAELAQPVTRPFAVAAWALRHLPGQVLRRPRDSATIARRVSAQALLRPLLFYAIVSTLIGYTVLYVISRIGGAGVRPDALIRQIGGSYVIALAPALSAILFVAASGSATNAWLGSMALGRQTLALEALGIDQKAYLWAPAWLALGLAYLMIAALFALGMIVGGYLVCRSLGMPDAWALLTADLIDPRPERAIYAARAGLLVWMYAWGIAADVVAKGTAAKPDADAVTRGMTASVVACTLWVVALELATVVWVLAR
jgi:ABC-type transporter Mla maintaining outer membrane lipid asymmetry ATPase subunit MlaF/ABC-type transporter Mla maintaining outer membrane lipid asymmetry permease subunit MlaE